MFDLIMAKCKRYLKPQDHTLYRKKLYKIAYIAYIQDIEVDIAY
jgi:hypothetical protein